MNPTRQISRRRILRHGVVVGSVAFVGRARISFGQFVGSEGPYIATPGQILGPAYPVEKPEDRDADLTVIEGRPERAQGKIIEIMGRVMTPQGAPVPNATLELWQANTHGKYTHPADLNPAPLDPNFEGYALLTSDADGRYRFKTIKPGAYPLGNGTMRPPHIHFDITGAQTRLVTQMYFPGEPLNETDGALNSVAAERRPLLLAKPDASSDSDVTRMVWDIVLASG